MGSTALAARLDPVALANSAMVSPSILIIPGMPDLDDPHLRPVRRNVRSVSGPSPGANIMAHAVAYPRLVQFGDAFSGGSDKRIASRITA
jgi:hypothetical protein